jgi:hypothetical protein
VGVLADRDKAHIEGNAHYPFTIMLKRVPDAGIRMIAKRKWCPGTIIPSRSWLSRHVEHETA